MYLLVLENLSSKCAINEKALDTSDLEWSGSNILGRVLHLANEITIYRRGEKQIAFPIVNDF